MSQQVPLNMATLDEGQLIAQLDKEIDLMGMAFYQFRKQYPEAHKKAKGKITLTIDFQGSSKSDSHVETSLMVKVSQPRFVMKGDLARMDGSTLKVNEFGTTRTADELLLEFGKKKEGVGEGDQNDNPDEEESPEE